MLTMTLDRIAPLGSLIGLAVSDAQTIHDYTALAFGPEVGLSIFNDWHIAPETAPLRDLLGCYVVAIHSSVDEVILAFDNAARLIIDLLPAAWNGPEALQLDRAGLPTVVWN